MLSAKPTRYPGAFFMDDRRRTTRLHEQTGGAQRCLCNSVQLLRGVEQDGVTSAFDIKIFIALRSSHTLLAVLKRAWRRTRAAANPKRRQR